MTGPRRQTPAWLGVAALMLVSGATAAVQSRAPEGFVVVHELSLAATPGRAYQALTDEISAWWDADHSYSGDAANLSLDARAGGCFCEILADGGSVEHLHVVFAAPGRRLRMTGGLGPLQGLGADGVMEFALAAGGDDRTLLRFTYAVGGYVPDGLAAMADPVDGMLGGQLARLQAYLESPP